MRALSEQAGLSIRTPYNLFGSKQAIMQALLDEDIQQFVQTLPTDELNELELFFEAVTHGTMAFAEDVEYYRAVMAAVYQEGGKQYRTTFRGPRRVFWRSLVDNAVRAGYLSKEVEVEPFSVNLAAIFFSHILEWVAEEIELDQVEARTHYGFGLALLALARPSHRKMLHERVLRAQQRLCAPAPVQGRTPSGPRAERVKPAAERASVSGNQKSVPRRRTVDGGRRSSEPRPARGRRGARLGPR